MYAHIFMKQRCKCIKKSAKDWFYLVEDKINNLDEFEKEFKE